MEKHNDLVTVCGYLHSTMLSIKLVLKKLKTLLNLIYIPLCYLLNKFPQNNPHMNKLIYIPLCYLLNQGKKIYSWVGYSIYIPLCYLLNKNSIKQGKKIYSIYIPLCYLLNVLM